MLTKDHIVHLPQRYVEFATIDEFKLEILVKQCDVNDDKYFDISQDVTEVLEDIFECPPRLDLYTELHVLYSFHSKDNRKILVLSLDRNPTPPVILLKADDLDHGHRLLDLLYLKDNFNKFLRKLLKHIDPNDEVDVSHFDVVDEDTLSTNQEINNEIVVDEDPLTTNQEINNEIIVDDNPLTTNQEINNEIIVDPSYVGADVLRETVHITESMDTIGSNDEITRRIAELTEKCKENTLPATNDENQTFDIQSSTASLVADNNTEVSDFFKNCHFFPENDEDQTFDIQSSTASLVADNNTDVSYPDEIISSFPTDYDPMNEDWHAPENRINKKRTDLTMPADVACVTNKVDPGKQIVKLLVHDIPCNTQRIHLKNFFKNQCLDNGDSIERVNIDANTNRAFVEVAGSGNAQEFVRCVDGREFCGQTVSVSIQREREDPYLMKLNCLVQEKERETQRCSTTNARSAPLHSAPLHSTPTLLDRYAVQQPLNNNTPSTNNNTTSTYNTTSKHTVSMDINRTRICSSEARFSENNAHLERTVPKLPRPPKTRSTVPGEDETENRERAQDRPPAQNEAPPNQQNAEQHDSCQKQDVDLQEPHAFSAAQSCVLKNEVSEPALDDHLSSSNDTVFDTNDTVSESIVRKDTVFEYIVSESIVTNNTVSESIVTNNTLSESIVRKDTVSEPSVRKDTISEPDRAVSHLIEHENSSGEEQHAAGKAFLVNQVPCSTEVNQVQATDVIDNLTDIFTSLDVIDHEPDTSAEEQVSICEREIRLEPYPSNNAWSDCLPLRLRALTERNIATPCTIRRVLVTSVEEDKIWVVEREEVPLLKKYNSILLISHSDLETCVVGDVVAVKIKQVFCRSVVEGATSETHVTVRLLDHGTVVDVNRNKVFGLGKMKSLSTRKALAVSHLLYQCKVKDVLQFGNMATNILLYREVDMMVYEDDTVDFLIRNEFTNSSFVGICVMGNTIRRTVIQDYPVDYHTTRHYTIAARSDQCIYLMDLEEGRVKGEEAHSTPSSRVQGEEAHSSTRVQDVMERRLQEEQLSEYDGTEFCAVKSEGTRYRGRVLSTDPITQQHTVYLVDRGQIVKTTHVYSLPLIYFDVPANVIRCKLQPTTPISELTVSSTLLGRISRAEGWRCGDCHVFQTN